MKGQWEERFESRYGAWRGFVDDPLSTCGWSTRLSDTSDAPGPTENAARPEAELSKLRRDLMARAGPGGMRSAHTREGLFFGWRRVRTSGPLRKLSSRASVNPLGADFGLDQPLNIERRPGSPIGTSYP